MADDYEHNTPDISHGSVGASEMNWKIDEGFDYHKDSTRLYKSPETVDEDIPNGTFVEAPDPTNDPYFRVGGEDANHMLLYDVSTVQHFGANMAQLVGDRFRTAGPDQFVWLLNINHAGGKRMWLKLYATGSATGALDSSTPINTALGIGSDGLIQLVQVGAATRAYLKRNNIATDGWILIEFVEPPQPYPTS